MVHDFFLNEETLKIIENRQQRLHGQTINKKRKIKTTAQLPTPLKKGHNFQHMNSLLQHAYGSFSAQNSLII